MKTSFKGRKWNGPVDEEGRPHGQGKMYEIRQKYGYKSYEPRNGYVSYDHRGEPWAYFSGEGMLYDENGENPRYTCINV